MIFRRLTKVNFIRLNHKQPTIFYFHAISFFNWILGLCIVTNFSATFLYYFKRPNLYTTKKKNRIKRQIVLFTFPNEQVKNCKRINLAFEYRKDISETLFSWTLIRKCDYLQHRWSGNKFQSCLFPAFIPLTKAFVDSVRNNGSLEMEQKYFYCIFISFVVSLIYKSC